MTVQDDYTLEWMPEKNGKVIVLAKSDGNIVHSDTIKIEDAKDRERFAQAMEQIGYSQDQTKSDLIGLIKEVVNKAEPEEQIQDSSEQLLAAMPDYVRQEARDVLQNGEPIERAYLDAGIVGVVGESLTIITLYLTGVSRLLKRPMAIIVQGSSSSGKSYSVESVEKLFPPETKLVAQQMTPQALFHLPPGALRNKYVISGERSRIENDDRAEATRALREMLSAGKLRKLMPEKVGGAIVTKLIEQDGPISYVESTTLGTIFEEDLNRCILIHTDETSEQTRRILRAAATNSFSTDERAIQRQYAIQRMLKPYEVVIPYAEALAEYFPAEKVETRRMFPMLLSCIQAATLLHQYQRQVDSDGRLIANEDDYATVFQIMRKPMAEQLGSGVSDVAGSYWEFLNETMGSSEFSARDVLSRDDNPKGRERTYSLIKELTNVNCLRVVDNRNRANVYRLNKSPCDAGSFLPAPAEFFSEDFRRTAGLRPICDASHFSETTCESGSELGPTRTVGLTPV